MSILSSPVNCLPSPCLPNIKNINFIPLCSIDDFRKNLSNSDISDLSILQLNCRSLAKNFSKIQTLLSHCSKKPNLIALSETWIPSSSKNLYVLNDYNLILVPRLNKRGGGVAIYIDSTLNFKLRSDITKDVATAHCEVIAVEINFHRSLSITVINCYRPPAGNVAMFIDQLSTVLDNICASDINANIILTGDFNIDLLNANCTSVVRFTDCMSSYNLYPTVLSATRVTDHHQSLIDNIFISSSLNILLTGIILEQISDHYPTFCILRCPHNIKLKPLLLNINTNPYKFSKNNFTDFNRLLAQNDWVSIYNNLVCQRATSDANTLFNYFYSIFMDLYNKAFKSTKIIPSKDLSIIKLNTKPPLPWLTPQLLRFCRIKSNLFKLYKRFNTNVARIKYKEYARA